MKGFIAFFNKEVRELGRTGRLLLLGILGVIFGIMNPAIAKLTPWLMEQMAEEIGMPLDDYSDVRTSLAVLVFDAERERENLDGTVYRRFENLAIVPVIYRCLSGRHSSCVKICSLWPSIWNVDPERMIDDALHNSPMVLPPAFGSIRDAIRAMHPELSDLLAYDSDPRMYYLSNRTRVYGASAMFYPDIMEVISGQLDADLFILPSSLHEIIILPDHGEDPSELLSVVREINEEYIEEQDVLSTSIFYYDRKLDHMRRVR